jgi:hypothetical protein
MDQGLAAPDSPVQVGMRRVCFQTVCVETGDTVISNAYMDLKLQPPIGKL